MNTAPVKQCYSCEGYKSVDDFYACATNPDGKSIYCKECVKAKAKEAYNRTAAKNKKKKCPLCKQSKDTKEFNKNKNALDGFQCYCRKCQALKNREYEAKNEPLRKKKAKVVPTYQQLPKLPMYPPNFAKNNGSSMDLQVPTSLIWKRKANFCPQWVFNFLTK